MSKTIDEKDFITAGAYYRLTKEIILCAAGNISRSLNLHKYQSNKLYAIHDKFTDLECKIGLEGIASYKGFSGELTDLFYGGLIGCESETDKAVLQKAKEILLSFVSEIDKALNKNS